MSSEVANMQMVSMRGRQVCILAPRTSMTPAEALTHAAWLVCMAEAAILLDQTAEYPNFPAILKAVRNT